MSDFEVDALIRELETLGVELRVVRRMDGSPRLSCWRTQRSWPNRDRINRLIAERIDGSPAMSEQIAEVISKRSTAAAADRSPPPPDADPQP